MLHTEQDVRAELQRQIANAGGVVAFARLSGISHATVSKAARGEINITETLANACGFGRVPAYHRSGMGVAPRKDGA